MVGELFLGLDVGTQGAKGLLVDAAAGRVVARASRAYGLIEGLPNGHAEQHPSTWETALIGLIGDLRAAAGSRPLAGLGVSGQQHGLVLVDAAGEVLRPAKLWCDTSTGAEAAELSAALGRHIPAGFTAPKVLWTQRREPAIFERARWVLLPHDWINFRLTGRAAMEAGDASGSGWLLPGTRQLDAAALAHLPGLAQRLPPLLEPREWLGRVEPAAALRFGLPPGLPVSVGAGDNMASAIGSGVLAPGRAALSLGTSGTLFGYSDRPLRDPKGWIADFLGSAGGHLPLLCVMNMTGVAEAVRNASGLDHGELTRRAAAEQPGAGGLMWMPFLCGERVPDLPQARGALLGMGPSALEPGPLYRAALEGTSLNLAAGAARMRELGLTLEQLSLVGGAARNPLWARILANALDLPVTPLEEPETAALGVALQAAWALAGSRGERLELGALAHRFAGGGGPPIEPDASWRSAYAALLERFLAERRRLYGV